MDVWGVEERDRYPTRQQTVDLHHLAIGRVVHRGGDDPHGDTAARCGLKLIVEVFVQQRVLLQVEAGRGAVDQRGDALAAVDRAPNQQRVIKIRRTPAPVVVKNLRDLGHQRRVIHDHLVLAVLVERGVGQVVGHDVRPPVVHNETLLVAETKGAGRVAHVDARAAQFFESRAIGLAAALRLRLDHHPHIDAPLRSSLQRVHHLVQCDEIDLEPDRFLRAVDGLHQRTLARVRQNHQLQAGRFGNRRDGS